MKSTILFILHMPPPVHGAAMMGKYIHDSILINDTFDCHYINLATAKNLEDIGKIGFSKVIQIWLLLIHIYKSVKALKPSLVYITPTSKGGAFIKDFLVVQLLKKMECQVVIHFHNKGVSTYKNKPLFNFLYKRFFKNIKVILLANALYKDIDYYVTPDQVFYCPNGIPHEQNSYTQSSKDSIPHILFLSNLLIEKGILTLVDACNLLKAKGCRFVCDVIGGETTDLNSQSFNKLIKDKGLEDVVVYHGKKYGDEKERYISKSNLFVFPTFYNNECFPLVLLEAMQHGKACISTDEGGIPDIIDDGVTGFIVEKRNSQQLAEHIEMLLEDQEKCREMGKAGYEKYNHLFTLNKFEEKLTDVLAELVNAN